MQVKLFVKFSVLASRMPASHVSNLVQAQLRRIRFVLKSPHLVATLKDAPINVAHDLSGKVRS